MFLQNMDFDSQRGYQFLPAFQRQNSYKKRLIDCNVQCDIWTKKPKSRPNNICDCQIDSNIYGCSINKGKIIERNQQRRQQRYQSERIFYSQPIQSINNSTTYFQQSNSFENGLQRLLENTCYNEVPRMEYEKIKQIRAAKPQIIKGNFQSKNENKEIEEPSFESNQHKKQKTKKKVEQQYSIQPISIQRVIKSEIQQRPQTIIYVNKLNYVQNNFAAQIDKLTEHYLHNLFGVWLLEVYPNSAIKKLNEIVKQFKYQEKQYFPVKERRFLLDCIHFTVNKYTDLASYVGKSLKDKKIPKEIKEWNQHPRITSDLAIANLGKTIVSDLKVYGSQLEQIWQQNYESKNFKKSQRQQAMDFIKQLTESIKKYRKQEASCQFRNKTNFFDDQPFEFMSEK